MVQISKPRSTPICSTIDWSPCSRSVAATPVRTAEWIRSISRLTDASRLAAASANMARSSDVSASLASERAIMPANSAMIAPIPTRNVTAPKSAWYAWSVTWRYHSRNDSETANTPVAANAPRSWYRSAPSSIRT